MHRGVGPPRVAGEQLSQLPAARRRLPFSSSLLLLLLLLCVSLIPRSSSCNFDARSGAEVEEEEEEAVAVAAAATRMEDQFVHYVLQRRLSAERATPGLRKPEV